MSFWNECIPESNNHFIVNNEYRNGLNVNIWGGSNQFCRYLLLPPHFHQPLLLCNGCGVQIFLLYTKVKSSNKGLGRYSDFLMTIHWDNFHSCHHNKEKDSRGLLKAQTTIYYYTSPTFILRIMPIYLS